MAEQHLEKTLADLLAQREQRIAEITKLDAAIDAIQKLVGTNSTGGRLTVSVSGSLPGASDSVVANLVVKPGDLFGKPQAEAAQEYLRRKGRAAHLDEMFAALQRGGANLQGKNPKRNLYISLVKKRSVFPLVAPQTFGLWEFYPEAKQKAMPGQSQIFEQLKEIMQDGKSHRVAEILRVMELKFGQKFVRSTVVSALRRGKQFRKVRRGAYKLKD
jgi:hypothetical protein